jgi:Asp-tRNA(Asn)/Glu-tRNA(Gln) amidotransferase A subunit family amidase
MGLPAITIPMPSASVLPLGVQIAAASGADNNLIAAGAWLEKLLARG